jgi:putative DNA primase/helicase
MNKVTDQIQAAVSSKNPNKDIVQRTFHEILSEANTFHKDTEPSVVDALTQETKSLTQLERRRIFEMIKKSTGFPLAVLEESLAESKEDEVDHLVLARRVVSKVESQNVLSTTAFVYIWTDNGVWKKIEERAIRKLVQHNIENDVDYLTKGTVDSVTDLFKTEVFNSDQKFNVGHPETVNCLNGQLSLVNSKWDLLPHIREDYRTTQIPVSYDPNASATKFTHFLEEVFKDDPDALEKQTALLEMIGYSLMAHCKHERFIILVGSGANGKSVLLSVLEALIGTDNVAGVQPSQFDRFFQRAHLHGKLANIVTEVKQGEVIDDASLKGIVSGEPTTVEHKFKDPFVMRPFSTCWFGTNHMPHTRDFSDALFRRALIVQFNQVFKPELGNCDSNLKDKLTSELSGILNLCLDAYASALQNGFTIPQSSKNACNEWRLEADQVAQFVEDNCQRDNEGIVSIKLLYSAYLEWARDSGINKTLTTKSFRDRLNRLGFGSKRQNSGMQVLGISVLQRDIRSGERY